jgi:hypothetical protein
MPTPKSSEKANTTDKIFSHEQIKNLSIPQIMEMEDQGWRMPNPVTDWKKEWKEEVDAQGFTYKSPDFDPAKHLISPDSGDTYVAGTIPNLPNPELEALRADPEMQQMAAGMGVTVDDLVLFREMMRDRFANRYNPKQSQQSDQSDAD